MGADPVPNRLQGSKAGAMFGGVYLDTRSRKVIDRDEDRHLPVLTRNGLGHIRAPHRIDTWRDNRPTRGLWTMRLSLTLRGQQPVCTHRR